MNQYNDAFGFHVHRLYSAKKELSNALMILTIQFLALKVKSEPSNSICWLSIFHYLSKL